jgi:hypothetical protein
MIKKKILIVCKGFYPQNHPRAFRATELAKEFALQGHDVTVLTPKDDQFHLAFEQEHSLKIKDLGTPRWKSPNYGTSKVGNILTRVFFRLLNLAFEYPDIELIFQTVKALKKERDYDLLISIAVPYPIHWGVAKAWKRNQRIAKTWVADCGDPYVGCTTDTFRKWFYWSWVEKWFMRKADFVTIPVESARTAYFPEFHSKIKIIPQGFKMDVQADKTFTPNSIPTFAYAGGFIPGIRDPRAFLDYLCTLKVDFRFYIYTNNRPLLESYQYKLKDKLIVSDFIPRTELLQKLSGMDFLVNFDNNTGTAVPSKLIDYVIIDRPVLNIKREPDTENYRRFMNGNYKGKMILPEIDRYRIENVCNAFLNLADGAK